MKATCMPRHHPSRDIDFADINWRLLSALLKKGGFHLAQDDRRRLRRRVEDALRNTGKDNILIEVAMRLGVRMD